MNKIEITTIKWHEFHPKDYIKILDSLPAGSHIRDLPYEVQSNAVRVRIPCEPDINAPFFIDRVSFRTMTFRKERTTDGAFIWCKENT